MTSQTASPVQAGATLNYDGKSVTLPVVRGTENETAIDIEKLRSATGLITLDPGFGNTGACRSAITFIDGEKGILRYRGYPIDVLAEKSTFLEVAWLLLHGELPVRTELASFTNEVTRHSMLHENFGRFFGALPKDAHPMPVCAAATARARDVLSAAGERAEYPRPPHGNPCWWTSGHRGAARAAH